MQMGAAAASSPPIDPLFSLLVGAFGAAVLTVSGGLIGVWIQSVREHRKWLRERRYEAYLHFMTDMSQISKIVRTEPTRENAADLKAKLDAWIDGVGRSMDEVSVLGPKSVNAAGQDWMAATTAFAVDRSEEKSESMSKGRWQFLITVGKELGSKNVGDAPPVGRPL